MDADDDEIVSYATWYFTSVTSFNRVSSFSRGRYLTRVFMADKSNKSSNTYKAAAAAVAAAATVSTVVVYSARTSSPIECFIFSDLDILLDATYIMTATANRRKYAFRMQNV